MIWRVTEKTLCLPGIKMDYIAFGTGKKPLVMVQGLNTRGIRGAGVSLALLYRIFAREYRVYLFDRRENLPDEITVRELAADLAAGMDALGISNADVFGVSQGGMIAQYLAMDRPDLVKSLVLAVTLARNNETVTAVIERWVRLTEQGKMKELVADMAEKMYSASYLNRYRLFLPLLTILQKPKDPRRFICLAQACLTCHTYEELKQIRCPVLVIGGKKDQIVGEQASEELAEKLQCACWLYEDLGHAAYEEAPDFNHRVMAFLHQQEACNEAL